MSALYRKYRPLDFSEVVGQRHVVRTLTNAVEAGRVRHAYLFAGPRGTGKTSLAKILAKSLNCQTADRPTVTPCKRCESCVGIQDATALDVIELDAASNRGIDDIREIRERVAMRPVLGRRKVYILDEAHSLTTDASNALLKTLEEPPDHVVFVLCTTEPHRLLDTIKGRCQSFAFVRPGVEDLRVVLHRVADAEGIAADDEAIGLMARQARGSFRDAVSTLDQLATAAGGDITAADARLLLGTTDEATLLELVDLVAARDSAGALQAVDRLAEGGADLGQLLADLLGHLRLLFLTHQLGAPPPSAPVTDETRAAVAQQATRMDERTLVHFIDGLLAVQDELRQGGDPQLPLEILLVKLTRPSAERSLDAMLRRLDALERGGTVAPAAPAAPAAKLAPAAPGGATPARAAAASNGSGAPAAAHTPAAPPPPAAIPTDEAELERIWQGEVVPGVRARKPSLASLLVDAHPLGAEHGALRVAFPSTKQFARSAADSDANRTVIAEVLGAVFGDRLRVVFETLDAAATAPAPAPTEPAVPPAHDPAAVLAHEETFLADIRELFDAHEVTEEA